MTMIKKASRKRKTNVVTGMYEPYEGELCISFYNKYLILKAYNQLNNIKLIHIANEQMTSKAYTMKLLRMGMTPGVADYLVAIKGGKCAFIEFKRTSKCKQSHNQIKFEVDITELGFEYYLVWNVECALSILEKLNS